MKAGCAFVGARHKSAIDRIQHPRNRRSPALPKIARVFVQDRGQYPVDENAPRNLIALGSGKTFSVSAPALAVTRLAIGGLLQARLKRISDVRADVERLMQRKRVFFAYR